MADKTKYGKLEVSYPTKRFLDWLDRTGLRYDLKTDSEGRPEYLTVEGWGLGTYNGMVGLSAFFDGEPLGSGEEPRTLELTPGEASILESVLSNIVDNPLPEEGFEFENLGTLSSMLDKVRALEEAPTPPALSEDEEAIPGFGEKFERCVLETKAKGGAVNPYAVCRHSLREAYSLPIKGK